MSITKRQFELGINNEIEGLMERIYALLFAAPDVAYSTPEISSQVGDPDANRLEAALEALQMVSAIEKRFVSDIPYYAVFNEVDTRTWERKVPV